MTESQDTRPVPFEQWPALRVADWTATRETLHMWTQIVGKVRLAAAPMINYWWQTPLYVSPRGLTTSSVRHGRRLFDLEFDFIDHLLRIRTTDGRQRSVKLEAKSVAVFYSETMAALSELGLAVTIRATPVEVVRAIPVADDTGHGPMTPQPCSCSGSSWCRPIAS